MSDQKCGLLILDAIDQLRKRKARPDLDRICHMLERRHGFKGTTVNDELQRLVNEGTVVKVDYKGNTSYRNAAKWVKTKTQFYGSFYNSNDISSVVLEAVRGLTMAGKDHPLRSASIIDIEQYLLKRDSQSNLNLATLRAVLEKEVDKQNLHQLPNGEFIPLKPNFSDSSTPEKSGSDTTKKPDSTPPKCELRVENQSLQILAPGGGGRSKEESKLDSDNICQENSSNSSEESQPSRCDYCLFTASANRKGEAEELLTCKDCGAKAHPSCMEYTKLLYEKYPDSLNWQCPDCKTCIVCEENNSTTDLLTCYTCFNAFHMSCHDPSITTKPTGIWLCSSCDTAVDKDKMAKAKTNGSDGKSEHEAYTFMDPFHKTLEEYPTTVPIARKWSIENVEEFFKFIGFEDEAPAFREQEIDGLSLLLMKRNDVLTGLGIKLGPALKIYKHIIALQARIGDN